jgi:hypothetical protein
MRRLGVITPILILLMALGSNVASATSNDRYAAPIDGHGIHGRVVVSLASDGSTGHLRWSLKGLKSGGLLVISLKGGTCKAPDGLVVRHRQPLTRSWSAGTRVLPAGSAGYFTDDWQNRNGVVAIVWSGGRRTCTPFHAVQQAS